MRLAVLVEKQRFRAFRARFAGAPRHHFFHLAGDATFFELGFEDLMDFRIFILILDLIAAFFAADFALAQHSGLACLPAVGGVLARDALIHHQVSGRCGTDVEVLMQPQPLACARKIKTALLPVAADARLIAALR
jgi:hypothetical protein